MCFWRTVFYWTAIQWVTQKTHTGNSKLHQKKNSQNFLIHQQLNCKQPTNQPETQRTTLSPCLQQNRAHSSYVCGDIRPCWAFCTVPCKSGALELAAHEDWPDEFLGLPLLWKGYGGALEPQELLTPVSEAEPQRQLHPEMITWSKNDHPFSSTSFQCPVFSACFVKVWKSQF